MATASDAQTRLRRHGLPSLHSCGAVIWAERASDGELDMLVAVGTLHADMVPDDLAEARLDRTGCRCGIGRLRRAAGLRFSIP